MVLAVNWRFFCCGGKVLLQPKKKEYTIVCLAGARSLLRPKKKDTVLCLAVARSLLRPEKKDTVVCLVGCAVVSVFGSSKKLAVFLLWREIFITTGKKRYSHLSGGLSCCVSFCFWREMGSFFVVAGKFFYDQKKKIQSTVWQVRDHYYDRKKKTGKKRYGRLSGGCAIIITTKKNKRYSRLRNHYYDRKKKIQLSVWRVVLLCQFLVLERNWHYFCCGGKVLLRPKKKKIQNIQFVLVQLELKLIQIR